MVLKFSFFINLSYDFLFTLLRLVPFSTFSPILDHCTDCIKSRKENYTITQFTNTLKKQKRDTNLIIFSYLLFLVLNDTQQLRYAEKEIALRKLSSAKKNKAHTKLTITKEFWYWNKKLCIFYSEKGRDDELNSNSVYITLLYSMYLKTWCFSMNFLFRSQWNVAVLQTMPHAGKCRENRNACYFLRFH